MYPTKVNRRSKIVNVIVCKIAIYEITQFGESTRVGYIIMDEQLYIIGKSLCHKYDSQSK